MHLNSIPLISQNKTGFRLSIVDLIVILVAILVTLFYPHHREAPDNVSALFHWMIPYVVANFFLFCNVFRIKTRYELCWLASATINIIGYLLVYSQEPVFLFFMIQSCFTLVAIIFEVKSVTYHGIFTHSIEETK